MAGEEGQASCVWQAGEEGRYMYIAGERGEGGLMRL